ncbi:IS3 family transposase [Streptomyces sp. NPDC058239]|uniref:IS3 family transposase n=1 Tax=Streptomyces sp. NPDC058239 TaxID=3346395 RepID=UPI0036E0EE4E
MINHLRDDFGVEPVYRELDLSVSAYNARRKRPKSARRLRDEHLVADIRRIHTGSGETHGARRIHRQLRREGVAGSGCPQLHQAAATTQRWWPFTSTRLQSASWRTPVPLKLGRLPSKMDREPIVGGVRRFPVRHGAHAIDA